VQGLSAFRDEARLGWRALLAAAVGLAFGLNSIPFYSLGVFARPLIAEFGWTRAEFQGALAAMMVGTVVSAWAVGGLLDRYGTRRVALASQIGLALGLAGLTLAGPSARSWLAAWFVMAVLGIGTSAITWTRGIAAWFERGRGFALGLGLTSTGLMAFLLPPVVTWLIGEHGWRTAYLVLAASVLVVGLPTVALLFREPPEAVLRRTFGGGVGLTLGEALRGRRFWLLIAAFMLVAGTVAGLLLNLVPLLIDRGLTPASAAWYASLVGLNVVLGRLVVGAMLDRFWAPGVGAVVLSIPALSCAVLASGTGEAWLLGLAAALIGFAAGAEFDLIAYLCTRYFGMRAYGRIYAWQWAAFSLAAGAGPALFGLAFDRAGHYGPALWGGAAALLGGGLLLLALGRYPAHGNAAR
jgi:MFS family permease